jgi:hypothetical protein
VRNYSLHSVSRRTARIVDVSSANRKSLGFDGGISIQVGFSSSIAQLTTSAFVGTYLVRQADFWAVWEKQTIHWKCDLIRSSLR